MGKIAAIKNPADDAINPIMFERNKTFARGSLGTPGLMPKSLCAFAISQGGSTMSITSFTSTGSPASGGTGNKTVNTNNKFLIGSKIYYYDGTATLTSGDDLRELYCSFESVDARYTAVTGTSVNLSTTAAASNVYLMVMIVDDYHWSPFYKSGSTTEIVVTSNNLQSGNFYIHLGKKTTSDDAYTFQLEDNNPLYYYDGTRLIDWASYIASQNSGGTYHKYNIFGSGNGVTLAASTNNMYEALNTHLSIPEGFYKVTMQLHMWWDNSTYNVAQNAEVLLRYYDSDNNTNLYLAGQTVVMTPMNSPNNMSYYLASNVVVLVGYLNLTASPSANSGIGLRVKGKDGMKLGYSQPVSGDNQMFQKSTLNDFILMERLGDAV